MLRKLTCLVVLVVGAGLVTAQTKDKGKDTTPPAKETKAKLVMVDVKKNLLTVEIDGKKKDLLIDKDVKIVGPQGGKADIKDKRLKPGAMLSLVMDGGKLKQVRLPYRGKGPAVKDSTGKDTVKDAVKDKKDK